MIESQQIRLTIDPASYKILIVDDVMYNITLLKALLKTEKYQITIANNGTQALEKVESERPDLILLDVMMPGLSGFDVSEKLKSSIQFNDIPIIFLTALNSHEDVVRGFQLGANDFITKPFNKDELKIRIKHQISLLEAKRIILKQTEELRSIIIGRDKLYSVIAHDLRGPLGSIKMILDLVLSKLEGADKEMLEMVKMANQTTEDVFMLLDNLLKWTKSQIGRLNTAIQIINITDIVRNSIEIFVATVRLKGIKIEFDFHCSCDVMVDRNMIKTVMRNLLSNAIKFSNPNGTINITIDNEDNDFVTVNVIDHGCGIKEENKSKLLHVASHFSTFGTSNEEGSGLGLLLCVDFVNKNGGRLWFESEEGVGSTFSFTLPKSK